MSEDNIEKLKARLVKLYALLDGGHTEEMAQEIEKFKRDIPKATPSLIGPLIDLGAVTSNPKPIQEAIALFDTLSEKYKDRMMLYNIGNAYSALHKIGLYNKQNIFDRDEEISKALSYYRKADGHDPQLLDNVGNLYDEIGRPIEALQFYERALKQDPRFGMSLGNKAQTIEQLAPITYAQYGDTYLVMAYQLYQKAIVNKISVLTYGGSQALKYLEARRDRIEAIFKKAHREARLNLDLTHPHPEYPSASDFIKRYSEYCLSRDLYLNLHIMSKHSDGSVGDDITLHLISKAKGKSYEEEKQQIDDISFRLNEIKETYISARLALFQSQHANNDFSTISEQTLIINTLDYAVSNIYVGYLKMAYKEVFSVLDKIAIFLNHYLELGHKEKNPRLYFNTIWYENLDHKNGAINEKIKEHGALLYGLFSLAREVKGSDLDEIRNALTHRYLRVYKALKGPDDTYMFEELTEETERLFFIVKCAIIYLNNFINSLESAKGHTTKDEGLAIELKLNTEQWLDLWH